MRSRLEESSRQSAREQRRRPRGRFAVWLIILLAGAGSLPAQQGEVPPPPEPPPSEAPAEQETPAPQSEDPSFDSTDPPSEGDATPDEPTAPIPTPPPPTPVDPAPVDPAPVDPALGAQIVVEAPLLDPWTSPPVAPDGAEALVPALIVTAPSEVRGTLHLTIAGTDHALPIPEPLPASWRARVDAIPTDPWQLPATGLDVAWRVIDPTGVSLARGETRLAVVTAAEALAHLEAHADTLAAGRDPLATARALERAAELALFLGLPDRADRHVVALRALAPRLAGVDASAARRSSIARVILSALVQRTYADADPVHRRAALDRIDRLGSATEEDPESAARCAIVLAEAALERLRTTPQGAEQRKLLDRARALAREARTGERSAWTTTEAELLWARVAIARGWRTESRETLARIVSSDPRVVARVAALGAEVAAIAGEPETVAAEIERAIASVEVLRAHAGSLAVDAGVVHTHAEPYRARIDRAARVGDGLATWCAIEAMRPRAPQDPIPTAALLEAARARWGNSTTLLACADLGSALVSVRADDRGVVAVWTETAIGATRERVRALLRARGSDPAAAEWLAERLLDPHESKFRRQVALAPLGSLRPIPFAVFRSSGRLFAEAHLTWSVPAATSVRGVSAVRLEGGPVCAYVDPDTDYNGDGAPDRPRLPSTVGETSAWEEVAGGFSRATGRAAREARLAVEAPWIRLLHLGCHGEFARHRPFDSELLLAPGDGHDGRLSAREIASLDLTRCALVCLSGCETGLTRAEGGDDLAGFPRAVLTAGAGAFLGSLWPVDDASAGAFFRNFHSALREEGDPRRALQRARVASRLDPGRRAPRHWAAWVLLEK